VEQSFLQCSLNTKMQVVKHLQQNAQIREKILQRMKRKVCGLASQYIMIFIVVSFLGGVNGASLQDGSTVPGWLANGLASGGGSCGCVALDRSDFLRLGRGGAAPIMPLLGVMSVWWMACGAGWRGSLGI